MIPQKSHMLTLFIFMLSLLLIHEMDAIRSKEWKMFIGLKDLKDDTAYKIFTIAHLPLYFVGFFILAQAGSLANTVLYFIMDGFLACHTVIHFCFRKHPANGFSSMFSQCIINLMGLLAIIHLCLMFFV